jgi:hypothetical protein
MFILLDGAKSKETYNNLSCRRRLSLHSLELVESTVWVDLKRDKSYGIDRILSWHMAAQYSLSVTNIQIKQGYGYPDGTVITSSRLLKKFLVDARQGGNGRKSAVYWRVHEHFEPISNAAWCRQRVFQQPASEGGEKMASRQSAYALPRAFMRWPCACTPACIAVHTRLSVFPTYGRGGSVSVLLKWVPLTGRGSMNDDICTNTGRKVGEWSGESVIELQTPIACIRVHLITAGSAERLVAKEMPHRDQLPTDLYSFNAYHIWGSDSAGNCLVGAHANRNETLEKVRRFSLIDHH